MTTDKNDRESSQELTDSGGNDDRRKKNDKIDDWLSELERELQEITKKWPNSISLH
jgi:hypothetical protein